MRTPHAGGGGFVQSLAFGLILTGLGMAFALLFILPMAYMSDQKEGGNKPHALIPSSCNRPAGRGVPEDRKNAVLPFGMQKQSKAV